MARLGVILDVTHLSDQSFGRRWIASAGRFWPATITVAPSSLINVSSTTTRSGRLLARDGVIGVALDAWMLTPGWTHGVSTNAGVGLTQVVDHIDHICQVAGGSGHVAIGSDLDGGFGREQSPYDLDTIADLQQLGGLLAGRGYGTHDVGAILHGNWLRLLRQNEQIEFLMARTGLSRQELLAGLSEQLPQAVNHLTPDGRLPTPDEVNRAV